MTTPSPPLPETLDDAHQEIIARRGAGERDGWTKGALMPTQFQLALSYPPDTEAAYVAWNASCGPCSIAAIIGARVNEIRDYLEEIGYRGFMNVTDIKATLDIIPGYRYWSIGPQLPKLGLAFIQWGGHDHKPVKVQYAFTHWIGVEGKKVFDVNARELISWDEWQRTIPRLIQAHGKGDGSFRVRTGIEVRLKSR